MCVVCCCMLVIAAKELTSHWWFYSICSLSVRPLNTTCPAQCPAESFIKLLIMRLKSIKAELKYNELDSFAQTWKKRKGSLCLQWSDTQHQMSSSSGTGECDTEQSWGLTHPVKSPPILIILCSSLWVKSTEFYTVSVNKITCFLLCIPLDKQLASIFFFQSPSLISCSLLESLTVCV